MNDQQLSERMRIVLDQLQDILNQTVRTTVMLDTLYMDLTIKRRIPPEEQ